MQRLVRRAVVAIVADPLAFAGLAFAGLSFAGPAAAEGPGAMPQARPLVPYEAAAPRAGDVARFHFGTRRTPADLSPRAIGRYGRGCLQGAVALPPDGDGWQAMRPSRNRAWGHPTLIEYLKALAADAPGFGWNGLLVGDLAQPRGGPMLTGHASHQIGLDADVWLTPMPDRRLTTEEREAMSAVSMLLADHTRVDPAVWTEAHARLIRRAASDDRVERIFVHPAIKRALCTFAGVGGAGAAAAAGEGAPAAWLAKVRPWYGHHYHFHVRLGCPDGETACRPQRPPPPGAGCGRGLDWWFTEEPYARKPGAQKRREITIGALPAACRKVLTAR